MTSPIPVEVLANHTAILGKTGSGKSSTEKVIVEEVVPAGFRVCVLDTTKSDWWGITSSADGKKPGLPFKILGGPRGHVPLHSSAGAVIGQLVGSGKLPLSIIDMADFEAGGLQRFFVDFAPALMRHAKGVLYLVIEEAHELAPKERAGIGAENLAIHWAKKLATAGRSKGIRLIVATQRVQALHNAVLGSCETVIAHRLTTPADQEPVLKWLKANTDKDTAAKVAASLSSLPTGTGWLCSGEAQVFEQIAFPKFKTFDNTATPTSDAEEITVKTAPVDQDELRAIIGDAVKEAEANDPKRLKAEIARLQAEARKVPAPAPAAAPAGPTPAEVEEIRRAAFLEGVEEGEKRGNPAGQALMLTRVRLALDGLQVDQAPAPSVAPAKSYEGPKSPSPAPRPVSAPATNLQKVQTAPGAEGDLTGPQRTVLRSLAWWARMGKDRPTRNQVAIMCGWSTNSSNIRDRCSELARAGMIDRPEPGRLQLTAAGAQAAPDPGAEGSLHENIRAVLKGPQTQVFNALLSAGGPVHRDQVAEACGWSTNSSNIRDRLSELARLDIIERPGPGLVALQPWVNE